MLIIQNHSIKNTQKFAIFNYIHRIYLIWLSGIFVKIQCLNSFLDVNGKENFLFHRNQTIKKYTEICHNFSHNDREWFCCKT